MKTIHLMLFIPLFLTACSIYKKQFDGTPDPGLPYTSVTDLEQMIVEPDEGPDLFLGVAANHYQIHRIHSSNRIWIMNRKGYIYVHPEEKCCKH